MADRPLTRDEIAYLERTKAALDAAFQTLLLSLGLLALPVGFLAFTLGGRGGWSGDRLATALSGAILLALIGAVIYYSALGRRQLKWDRLTFRAWRGLSLDLESGQASIETADVTSKSHLTQDGGGQDGPRRRYFVGMGDRRFQLSGPRWMALAPGDAVTLEVAPHSGVVLAIDGLPDRLPIAAAPEREEELQRPGRG